jgi:ATP-binding cassette subfamily F protein 3
MLVVSNIHKRYGGVPLLERVSFTLNRGERAGLVGPNGCGKTTLLRLISGQEPPDEGSITLVPGNLRVGYLPQGWTLAPGVTVGHLLLGAADGEPLERRLEQITAAMAVAEGDHLQALLRRYDETLAELTAGGYARAARLEGVLAGLGLAHIDLETPVDILSGGQKTRLGLARLLLDEPDLLLLDEPTNHLDLEALQWLEEFLANFDGGILIVSHDRAFLDRVVTTVLEIDPLTHHLTVYPGAYSDYAAAKERERERLWDAYQDQQERIARIESDIRSLKQHSAAIEGESLHFHYHRIAKDLARTAVVRERKLRRLLDSEDKIEKPQRSWTMRLEFGETPASGQDVLKLDEVSMEFPGRPLFAGVNLVARHGERIALLGPNGSGKTTLLRLIAGEMAPQSGQIRLGTNVRPGYYAQEQEILDPQSTAFATIRAIAPLSETEVRSFLHYFLFAGDEVFVPISNLSYGERARLALGRLVAMGCNLLLLDEPINHLDIPSRTAFEQALANFGGTVIAAVHDRYFVERFATRVWHIEDGAVRSYIDLDDMLRQRGRPG